MTAKGETSQKWGTIEHKDPNGNVITSKEGLIVGRGETKKVIVPEEVEKLAELWCTYEEIATILGISTMVLTYNFMESITKGRANTKIALRKAQIKNALGGNTTMQIWLGKNILGQSDQPAGAAGNEPLPWSDD